MAAALTVPSGFDINYRNSVDFTGATVTFKDDQIPRAKITQEDLAQVGIALTDARVHDSVTSPLPASAGGADDMYFYNGGTGYGTDALTIRTDDANGATVEQYLRLQIPIGNDWVIGQTMTLRVRARIVTTLADGEKVVDVQAFLPDGDGSVGSDVCSTAEQTISTSWANYDFTITASSPTHGDVMDVRIRIDMTDSGSGAGVVGEISTIKLLRDIRG